MKQRILVIGAGCAGLTAAVAAGKGGAEVTVIGKVPRGYASCTAYAEGVFTLPGKGYTVEAHEAKTLEIGCGLNDPELVRAVVRESEAVLEEMASWGLSVDRSVPGSASVHHTAPTDILGGYGMVDELQRIALSLGVRFLENRVVTRLVRDDGRIRGVECVHWETGRAEALGASAVILATGGAGRIYARSDNPARITGDGYALALEAGATLRDMEFVQFYPMGMDEPGFGTWLLDLSLIDMVPLVNREGRRFLNEAIASWGLASGDEANYVARAASSQTIEQLIRGGDEALLHLEELPPEAWESPRMATVRPLYPAGVAPWEYGPVHVRPLEHYMPGGVVVDSRGATEIPGLFACGEVTGGFDGAGRVGGNALTSSVTLGLFAGKASLDAAFPPPEGLDPEETRGMLRQWEGGTVAPEELRGQVQQLCTEHLGPVRNRRGLEDALARLDDLREKIALLGPREPTRLLETLEMRGMITTARCVAAAAQAREESRGCHYREDRPEQSEAWRRIVTLRGGEGAEWTVGFRPVEPWKAME
ncbi:MAG: FAD-binding protein [Synergistales bacterium]|nr:FAD-binding protein [Synergistales bacterium]